MSNQNPSVWFISDTHLGHRKIIEFEPMRAALFSTIEDHDKAILGLWRARVKKHDIVYCLGDMAWSAKALEQLRNLPGKKKLVMGNHDKFAMSQYMEIFVKISSYFEFDHCVLSHIPLSIGSIRPRYRGNIHGHLHGSKVHSKYHCCICPEQLGDFGPVQIDAFVDRMTGFDTIPQRAQEIQGIAETEALE